MQGGKWHVALTQSSTPTHQIKAPLPQGQGDTTLLPHPVTVLRTHFTESGPALSYLWDDGFQNVITKTKHTNSQQQKSRSPEPLIHHPYIFLYFKYSNNL